MKNVLLLLDGEVARAFLERIFATDVTDSKYHIVYYRDDTLCENLPEQYTYHKFDPTSFSKLSELLLEYEFMQITVVMSKQIDMMSCYENIRKVEPNLSIVLLDHWNSKIDDLNITMIDAYDVISNMLYNHLPGIPLTAKNLGLGKGEIMEFKIPFGSPFILRHISNIDQKRWRIAAIYREHQQILPTAKTMIQPNDSILAVGNPNVLKDVYKSMKQEVGLFPMPYGENLYCLLDMKTMSKDEMEKLTNDAMLLHSNLNNKKLIFRVLNPTFSKLLDKIKSYNSEYMLVELDLYSENKYDLIIADINHFYIGVFITNKSFFQEHVELLYNLKIPIFKIGMSSMFNIKESTIFSSDSKKVEKLASSIFDIASQLKIDITLYDFEYDEDDENKKIIENFQNLSKLFQEKVNIVEIKKNPILELSEKNDFLQYVIFEKHITTPSIFSFFFTSLEKQYDKLSRGYQLFLPID